MSPGDLRIVGSICKRCGKPYYLTARRIEWYLKKGFDLPKRCPECLKERRSKNVIRTKQRVAY